MNSSHWKAAFAWSRLLSSRRLAFSTDKPCLSCRHAPYSGMSYGQHKQAYSFHTDICITFPFFCQLVEGNCLQQRSSVLVESPHSFLKPWGNQDSQKSMEFNLQITEGNRALVSLFPQPHLQLEQLKSVTVKLILPVTVNSGFQMAWQWLSDCWFLCTYV